MIFQPGIVTHMAILLLIALNLLLDGVQIQVHGFDTPWLMRQSFCARRHRSNQCCAGRDDTCTVPIADTYCYCDIFCSRTVSDCCPDFWRHCLQVPPPHGAQTVPPTTTIRTPNVDNCVDNNGKFYQLGESIMRNCNKCTCSKTSKSKVSLQWKCDDEACLIRSEMIKRVNYLDIGWKAANYSFLNGLKLKYGIRYRLGTRRPERIVSRMHPIKTYIKKGLPSSFDARTHWPGMIHPIQDQGNCGASWAFSTASVASDRLSIHSRGGMNKRLSTQQLISCNNNHQGGCNGGSIDRAWFYLHRYGLVDSKCYPYQSGNTNTNGQCRVNRGELMRKSVRCPTNVISNQVYQSTPAYRINSNKEEEIMQEIRENGPVQATMAVKEDFFVYKRGVYQYSRAADQDAPKYRQSGYHSVKIIGWGIALKHNNRPVKYWLCANSWGPNWGEKGYFKIIRGVNECGIESFVVGAWAKVNGKQVLRNTPTRLRLRQFRKELKLFKRRRRY